MHDESEYQDEFEYYEALHDPAVSAETRRLKIRADHRPKKTTAEILAEIAEPAALDGGFNITYQPARYESGWLLDSLRGFFEQDYITDVLAMVKGGKEASVYRCRAHPATGETLLAAKVYRPRKFRNLRNDKMYREGRQILTADGRPVKSTDHRIMRALGKKTDFGVQVAHTSWLMHEYNIMSQLYRAGAAVPRPIAAGDNAVLMAYVGDENIGAPTLSEVDLGPGEPEPLFAEVMRNVELMLSHGVVHGDLSAYNLLYWEGAITVIDWPQVTNVTTNRQARFIFNRDVTRVCQYFATQGVHRDPAALAEELWQRYVGDRSDEEALEAQMVTEEWDDWTEDFDD
ncbi:MAG: RIO1 family regulatory kinase/ATPase [Anaerolineae bacterium]